MEGGSDREGERIGLRVCLTLGGPQRGHAQSDIDLLVAGEVGLADLTPTLRRAEVRLGREVNVTSYSAAEFRRKTGAKDHLLTEVLRGPKQFVKGDQRDVDNLIGKPRRSTA